MLVAYCPRGGALKAVPVSPDGEVPEGTVWLDLSVPANSEDKVVERAVGVEIPTREEMAEIEASSRLYVEQGARYMTLTVLCGSQTETPELAPVTFILTDKALVTVRYAEPRAFGVLAERLARSCPTTLTGETIMVELLDTIVDRIADVLEQCGAGIDRLSRRTFETRSKSGNANQVYRAILTQLGRKERLTSHARESLSSLARFLAFLGADVEARPIGAAGRSAIKSMNRDVSGLSDYAAFLVNKLQFLLDATIGMVGLEQNNIIKIFAVLSVVLMPPTLIASIYGMNFQHMPELAYTYGYPLALCAMVVSGILPYLFFKWRRWL
ncbi:magnesium transporter [Azorhizobium oxalatiphilum]|uniref:Magnesium transport protein CorA n=1 Tax=Azorhizobium oxalatiphilum TaxID=980631 RepID=A0A917CB85_9HYPH|nr:magnesium transporter CorA family protein [Azorhizobium oxalatiphilum]GGF82876.1 magnesium transporter [Azorhizobium oxalatiphilum]